MEISNITSIGFAKELIPLIKNGTKTLTYRIGNKFSFLKVGDRINIKDSTTGIDFATVEINEIGHTTFKDLPIDRVGHEVYGSKEKQRETFKKYYKQEILDNEPILIIGFKVLHYITETNIPVVSAIIERNNNGETEILIQTRWKPERDPEYSGTLEIPAGWMDKYENVYDALKREVLEETGLNVINIKPNIKTVIHSPKDDGAFAFVPFCCQQQIKGGKPWVGFVFLCEVENKEPIAQAEEVKDIRWIKKSELKEIFEKAPEKIFTLQLGVLDYYLNC